MATEEAIDLIAQFLSHFGRGQYGEPLEAAQALEERLRARGHIILTEVEHTTGWKTV